MKGKITFFLSIILACCIHISRADSPLTSTDIASAYQDESIIQYAATLNGKLDKKTMNYLYNSKHPVAVKLALINKLSWDIDGKSNATEFIKFLRQKGAFSNMENFTYNNSRSDLMICLAYLKAMDNYFDVKEARVLAREAKRFDIYSYAVHIVAALIESQYQFDRNWCDVYRVVAAVDQDPLLERDMRQEAVDNIFDYIGLYKGSCEQ